MKPLSYPAYSHSLPQMNSDGVNGCDFPSRKGTIYTILLAKSRVGAWGWRRSQVRIDKKVSSPPIPCPVFAFANSTVHRAPTRRAQQDLLIEEKGAPCPSV